MQTDAIKVVEFFTSDELSDDAKERARDWYRSKLDITTDYEHVFDHAATIADLIGIDLRTKPIKLMNGETRFDPCIYFSGFWSQGDGACFEGNYAYRKGSAKLVRKHAPKDTELHKIVDTLAAIQRRYLYRLEAITKYRGHYYHSDCMEIDVYDRDANFCEIGEAQEDIAQALRDFADWIYDQLRSECEYQMSDENVDECLRINEYTFDEIGNRERMINR